MFKLMLVRFDRDRGEFADQEFNKFCQEHSIIRIDKEFINCNDNIFYSFFIEYLPRKTAYEKPDLTQLSEIQQKQYNRLRDWRNELAANEGLPAYIILYNSQLYEIVKRQPVAKADFAAIKGMKNKADKYGEQIIKVLQEAELSHEEE
ncbi:MAG: HRDC domain-containing protein [Candidatus Cloacimonetes bacterium]|nr:HRDC domain-containing protein [Candidatus Cloacimonadota bacterium]